MRTLMIAAALASALAMPPQPASAAYTYTCEDIRFLADNTITRKQEGMTEQAMLDALASAEDIPADLAEVMEFMILLVHMRPTASTEAERIEDAREFTEWMYTNCVEGM